jgi:citrate lyase subunit beta/citryl-CoA lyase
MRKSRVGAIGASLVQGRTCATTRIVVQGILRSTARPLPIRLYSNVQASENAVALRSLLFVPGREEMLEKVLKKAEAGAGGGAPGTSSGGGEWVKPDILIPDMEDSVPAAEKATGRAAVQRFLPRFARTVPHLKLLPRVNSLHSGLIEDDLSGLGPEIYGISVGKVANAQEMREIDLLVSRLEKKNKIQEGRLRLIPWLETASGIANALQICQASSRIVAVAFGADDFLTDMGIQGSSDEMAGTSALLTHARAAIALAARASNTLALETPFVNFRSEEGLKRAATAAKRMGFHGMFAIHPNQVASINATFSPSEEEVKHAERVVAAYEEAQRQGKGSTSLDGKMIDAPVVKRAYALLQAIRSLNK